MIDKKKSTIKIKVGLIPLIFGIIFTVGGVLGFIVAIGGVGSTIIPALIIIIIGIILVIIGIIILIKYPDCNTDFPFDAIA